jgi:hypothetical protein
MTPGRALERTRKLALLQLIDDVDLVLDDVPNVEVVVARNVNQLPRQAIRLQRGEEHFGVPVGYRQSGNPRGSLPAHEEVTRPRCRF